MSHFVDVRFALVGSATIPADHGYAVYSALSQILPWVHAAKEIGIHPIRGMQDGNRRLHLGHSSQLTFRCKADIIAEFLPLAGKSIEVESAAIRIGIPTIQPLIPSCSLRCRLVTIKLSDEINEQTFLASARKQLTQLNVQEAVLASIPWRRDSLDTAECRPLRRTLRVKDKQVVGYELILEGLTAEESLVIQEKGIGGRRKMGCGIFLPLKNKETTNE
ncbi:MAG: type I-MYXAN CRISPR-associated protein Cas6/Cmx6 [bacterium]|nr:type I-MYXAN CRISPR-associated protein Cas6/Cmx6 [bacterium]